MLAHKAFIMQSRNVREVIKAMGSLDIPLLPKRGTVIRTKSIKDKNMECMHNTS